MKKINIYYSIPDIYPAFRVDLVELFSHYLKKKGLQVSWLMESAEASILAKKVRFHDEQCILPTKLFAKNKLAKVLNKLIFWTSDVFLMCKAAAQNHQILQVRDKYIVSLAGILGAKIFGKKFVYWCSYPFPEHYLELARLSYGLKHLYYKLHGLLARFVLYRVIMPHADWVFVQSDYMKAEIAQYGVCADKMTAVPMGVPERLLAWAKPDNTHITPQQVTYIGIMTPERHLEMLIDAFAMVKQRCPQASFLMVGDGVFPHEREALEAQASRLGIRQSIQFTGFVPLEQAWTYAALAEVCVSPICPNKVLNCGSPTKLYEYMALGRPVVCNQHPDQTRVIAESGAGICTEWNSQSFAEAIIWMLEHPQEAAVMAAKGPTWIRENRHYEKISEVVMQRYCALAGVQ